MKKIMGTIYLLAIVLINVYLYNYSNQSWSLALIR
jgi:hypothetical protein